MRCKSACPAECITGDSGNSINIDRESCTRCFECVKVCPSKALSQKGAVYTVDEVVDVVMRDQEFFKASNGGVTLSGGEVLGQYEFCIQLLKALKESDISTAVETSGYAPWEHIKSVADYCDIVLYDIKHHDGRKHSQYTGVDNELIINNLRRLIEYGANVVVRIPLIPGVNMDEESIDEIISLLKDINVKKVDVLPFHQLGRSKYAALGMKYSLGESDSVKEEDVAELRERFKANDFEISIGG
jgi:pyruvate formate lyase activating enzyme